VWFDDHIHEWLNEKDVFYADEGDVRPVLCALQGHPIYGSILDGKVDFIIKDGLEFISVVQAP
jgi:hypothetical protein